MFQGLGPFKDIALAFPEEWRHVTPAQIDCFGEYVEPQDCGASPPGKIVSIPQERDQGVWKLGFLPLLQISESGAILTKEGDFITHE